MNDFVGCLNTHIGETRYFLPEGFYVDNKEGKEAFKPHSAFVAKDFSKYITLPEGVKWTFGMSLALWGYDKNNTDTVTKALLSPFVLKKNLNPAVTIIESYFGNYGRLDDTFYYRANNESYIIGSKNSGTIFGYHDADDIIWGNQGADNIRGLYGNDQIFGGGGNDVICGDQGNDYINGGSGNDILIGGDGNDIINDEAGVDDVVQFDKTVDSSKIAIFKEGNDLIIDYGNIAGDDVIRIKNQQLENNAIERIQLSDNKYLSDGDINKIIQNMTAYAASNGIEFSCMESVKNNEELMNLVASSWHV